MRRLNVLKNCFLNLMLLITTLASAQKLTFKIKNDSINKKIFITSIDGTILESIYEKENIFEVDYLNLDEGYYLLKKDKNSVVLYLKPTDELKISFDNDDFYRSLTFSGEGAYVNAYLLNKKLGFLDKRGRYKNYYKKEVYEGGEEAYLSKLDKIYKESYGILFTGQLDKTFADEEMKNLQYGYSLDLLKYQDAKKYYRLKDSLTPSKQFLEPLNHIHFQNSQLYQKYESYKNLSVLKWKNNIDEVAEPSLNPQKTKDYFQLIKKNTNDKKLLLKAKEKYAEIKHVQAEKNLSKFQFKNSNNEPESLSQFKGKFIFLNIWTTWCKSCLNDIKELELLKEKFDGENIEFLSISVNKPEEYDAWKDFLGKNELNGKHLFLNDSKVNFIDTYKLKSIPSFIVLSSKGVPLEISIDKLMSRKTENTLKDFLKD